MHGGPEPGHLLLRADGAAGQDSPSGGGRANAHTWRGTEVSVWGGDLGLLPDLGASCS